MAIWGNVDRHLYFRLVKNWRISSGDATPSDIWVQNVKVSCKRLYLSSLHPRCQIKTFIQKSLWKYLSCLIVDILQQVHCVVGSKMRIVKKYQMRGRCVKLRGRRKWRNLKSMVVPLLQMEESESEKGNMWKGLQIQLTSIKPPRQKLCKYKSTKK